VLRVLVLSYLFWVAFIKTTLYLSSITVLDLWNTVQGVHAGKGEVLQAQLWKAIVARDVFIAFSDSKDSQLAQK
jgi:hypothetical protein